MELDQQPMAGRPPAKEIIAKMIEAREVLVYCDAQFQQAQERRSEAYEAAQAAEAAVKTIPELQCGGVIVMDGKAYMLRKGQSVWGTGDPKDMHVEIREVAE